MTRLRQIALAGLAAAAIGGAASSASAMETGTFQNRLNGATIGLPLGAAPPPGIYSGLETSYLGLQPRGGNSAGNQCAPALAANGRGCAILPAIADSVPLLWVPGWNPLGATYTASVVQSFYVFVACNGGTSFNGNCLGAAPFGAGGFVYTNTFIQPINLSWNLGHGWFVAGAFSFTPPDGTRFTGTPNPDYWTLEPSFAASYLGSNWVLSANIFYDFNTRSDGVCCAATRITSGEAIYGDFTAVYKIGKWTLGPVGYTEIQTTNDTGPGCALTPTLCGRYRTAAAGGLVGYDFGPVDMQVWATGSFVGQNTPQGTGGVNVWSRIGFKIWGFEQPAMRPLVSKN
jgi:hypothetical protein